MMQREIEIHSRLKHENVVQFLESFEDGKYIYIIQSLCSNNTLANLLMLRGSMTLDESRYILSQILEGLLYIHRMDIIHRDVKCANISIDNHMQMKICDFGLAIRIEDVPFERRDLR